MDRQIVVPLDGSPLAERILPYAGAMAAATGGALHLIRVVPPGRSLLAFADPALISPDADRRWEAEEVAAAGTYLAELTRRLIASGVVTQHQVLVAEEVAAAIVERAQPHHMVGMIAMATHGRSGISHFLMGSVAEDVLRHAPVPLLLTRPAADPVESVAYRTIVVPLDGSPFAEEALVLAKRVAAGAGSTVLLLAVAPAVDDMGLADGGIEPLWLLADRESEVERIDDYLERQVERLRHAGIEAPALAVDGDPADAIVRVSAEHNADLIVMATHGRGGLRRILMGSVARSVIGHARRPILLVRPSGHEQGRDVA